MRIHLDYLYKKLYQATEESDKLSYSKQIDELLYQSGVSKIQLFYARNKEKPFMKNLLELIHSKDIYSLNALNVAKVISSHITHTIIETEKTGIETISDMKLPEQSELLMKYLNGTINVDLVISFYKELYNEIR